MLKNLLWVYNQNSFQTGFLVAVYTTNWKTEKPVNDFVIMHIG